MGSGTRVMHGVRGAVKAGRADADGAGDEAEGGSDGLDGGGQVRVAA